MGWDKITQTGTKAWGGTAICCMSTQKPHYSEWVLLAECCRLQPAPLWVHLSLSGPFLLGTPVGRALLLLPVGGLHSPLLLPVASGRSEECTTLASLLVPDIGDQLGMRRSPCSRHHPHLWTGQPWGVRLIQVLARESGGGGRRGNTAWPPVPGTSKLSSQGCMLPSL